MTHYLYHWVPKNMTGSVLYPLNELKHNYPNIYAEAVKKYEGREHLLTDKVEILDCLWNDVLHLSPIHPSQIQAAYRANGKSINLRCFQIDAGSLDPAKTVIYYDPMDRSKKYDLTTWGRFSPEKLEQLGTLPDKTKAYYKACFDDDERPLLFAGVPHILYQGSIDITDLTIVGEVEKLQDHEVLYQTQNHVWGTKPSEAIADNVDYLADGSVLDLGAGDGRNTLYLAERGFEVTAVDIAPTAIIKLNKFAKERDIAGKVEGIVADVATYVSKRQYNNVISTFTLHFLDAAAFPAVFERTLAATLPGGINIIEDFTSNGPLYRADSTGYWFRSGELKDLYAAHGWEIIHYSERISRTKAVDENGHQFEQQSATVIARKPNE